jgi:adenylylsulfate kinase-like enzyme
VPEAAELIIDTTDTDITTCVDRIIAYVEREFVVGAATVGSNHS